MNERITVVGRITNLTTEDGNRAPDLAVLLKAQNNRRAPAGGILHGDTHYRGGQFIPATLWEQEKQVAHDALPGLLESFGERLQLLRAVYDQNAQLLQEGTTKVKLVSLTTLEAQMKAAVREAYIRAFLLGKRAAGNLTSATGDEQAAVKRLRLDEFQYLRGFLGDMRNQGGTMDYTRRMDYYTFAARELFWLGWVLGNPDPARRISWVKGPTESCIDCLRFSENGSYTFEDFKKQVLERGYLPQSGKLACLGRNCQCRLEES